MKWVRRLRCEGAIEWLRTESPLQMKVWRGELLSVKDLVKEAGADVNMPLQNPWGNALETAAHSQDVNTLRFLVQEGGGKVNAPSTGGKYGSPLAAACHGNLENVKYMVDAGADINMHACWELRKCPHSSGKFQQARESQGGRFGSALAAAAYMNEDLEIGKCLIEADADVTSPLSMVIMVARSRPLVQEVITATKVSSAWVVGSALAAAVWKRIYYKLEILLNAGADVNMVLKRRDFGSAVAIAATFSNDDGTVDTLLEAGADTNLKHPEGRYASPLIAAACFGQTGAVKSLINAGADVNAKFDGSPYTTALQAAKADIAEEDKAWLLRACNGSEMDVEEFAEEWTEQRPDVVELLEKHGATA